MAFIHSWPSSMSAYAACQKPKAASAAGHYKQQWPSSMHVSLCSMSEAAGHYKQQWPSSMHVSLGSMSEAAGHYKQQWPSSMSEVAGHYKQQWPSSMSGYAAWHSFIHGLAACQLMQHVRSSWAL